MKFLLTFLLAATSVIAADEKLTVGQFDFTIVAPWKKAENTGMMTKAILAWPVEGGTPIEAKFYDFGGPSGGIEANITRWISQFEGKPEVKKEELTFGNTKVILLTASGTYLDGAPMSPTKTPRPDYILCGAILAGDQSNVFIKMTGPKAVMDKAAVDFKKLATSPVAK
ncbi:MAG: hypothetical protein K8R87_07960 [Verrucomicrobia bacterium]|nr:hypothetical protein [Verrucomicrobiota bacterium]